MSNNVLIWDRVALFTSLLLGYEINFVVLIWVEIYERTFGVTTTLSFPFLIHQLCEVVGVTKIPNTDKGIEVIRTTNIA